MQIALFFGEHIHKIFTKNYLTKFFNYLKLYMNQSQNLFLHFPVGLFIKFSQKTS